MLRALEVVLAMLIVGIDIGSGTAKCVLVDDRRHVRGPRSQVKIKVDSRR